MISMKKKMIGIVCLCAVLGLAFGFMYSKDSPADSSPVSMYEQMHDKAYDELRMEPKDMGELLNQWENKTMKEDGIYSSVSGWKPVIRRLQRGTRYYAKPGAFVIGWQYLERDGTCDWYYFDEKTGFMVKDTILDGVVLSKEGYAKAIAADCAETIENIGKSQHCKEVLLIDDIETDHKIIVEKQVSLVTMKDTEQIIRGERDNETLMTAILEVKGNGELTLGEGIVLDTCKVARNGIQIKDNGSVFCYGKVNSTGEKTGKYGVAALGKNTSVTMCAGAEIYGAETGVYSEGTTILKSEEDDTDSWIKPMVVNAATVSSGKMISENSDHGIVQNGGTLTMSGGTIFNNGTLGSDKTTGSLGGGVYLKNNATMNMSGGVISGNRASYGGGIYVSSGCKLNITGGTIGGSKIYESKEKNTTVNGNYAREHKRTANGTKYARGSGGGIYSEGTVSINGKNTVNITCNVSKGPGGAGGILVYSGKTYITGNVNVSNNKTWHSDGENSSQVASGDPNGEGAGIRVGYDSENKTAKCMINCTDKAGYPVTSGTVLIQNNQSSGDGGGIYVSNGTGMMLVIKGNTKIKNNVSQNSGGGGVKTLGGKLWIYDAEISGNRAIAGKGGGVQSAGETILSGCKIYNNTSEQEGGGVCFYTSSVGTTGSGTIQKCNIYENASGYGGAGVEVRNDSEVLVRNESRIYSNKKTGPGIRCTNNGRLILEDCYLYGNQHYGLQNDATTVVNGNTRIGFESYHSLSAYSANTNGNGAIYNTGAFTVHKGKKLQIYSAGVTGIYNIGTATFQNGSSSTLLGKNALALIKNKGTLNAVGADEQLEGLAMLYGTDVTSGIDNDGGVVKWSGCINGEYLVETDKIQVLESSVNIQTGITNQTNGTVTLYTESSVSNCEVGVHNKTDSTAYLAGEYIKNSRCGVRNAGDVYLGTVGNMNLSMDDIVGIYNTGILYGNEDGAYICSIIGTGTGIQNEGVSYLGKSIRIGASEKEKRTGIYNASTGVLHLSGGEYRNSSEYGVYCADGSRFFMEADACIEDSNTVFLEPACKIEISEELKTKGVVAVIDTQEGKDRFPGRIVVQVNYEGGTGKKELYDSNGERRFLLSYDILDDGFPAILFDGSRIDTIEEVGITEKQIYVSSQYPVTFFSGYEQITGAQASDLNMTQVPLTKYWMEDLLLDLKAPTLLDVVLASSGWTFGGWEDDDKRLFTETAEWYTENCPLQLTAKWGANATQNLEAWLYDRSSWLRDGMSKSKRDEEYKHFLAGDTGVITFLCKNLTKVSIVWPSTGALDELKTYDTGQCLKNEEFDILLLTDKLSDPYENSSYQFKVPLQTPPGVYYVTVTGVDQHGNTLEVVLNLVVENKSIATTIRTRIR